MVSKDGRPRALPREGPGPGPGPGQAYCVARWRLAAAGTAPPAGGGFRERAAPVVAGRGRRRGGTARPRRRQGPVSGRSASAGAGWPVLAVRGALPAPGLALGAAGQGPGSALPRGWVGAAFGPSAPGKRFRFRDSSAWDQQRSSMKG